MQTESTYKTRWQSKLVFWSLLLLLPGVVAGPSAANDSGPAELQSNTIDNQMDAWWTDLEKDEAAATRAVLEMYTRPEAAVAFLKDKLKPLTLDSVRLKAYLLRLGSSKEALWKKAFEDLEYYDPRLAMDLESLVNHVTETPARERLVEVLCEREPGSLFLLRAAALGATHSPVRKGLPTLAVEKVGGPISAA